ncbi:MAG: NAD(P)H-dependent oxidoreductase [Gammaproteobacteria bacterium]|nr:NAD(P)H-dependent oxidoreductase [Gammaproteobacteria bacterium]
MSYQLLRINASANPQASTSNQLADHYQSLLQQHHPEMQTTLRDVAQGLPLIDQDWVAASFTPAEQRQESQRERLAISDQLVQELEDADHILLSTPMYNFSVPASLKAWIDLIARAGKTFQYTEAGPQGLLRDKSVTIIVATGGTPVNSEVDFLTGYLQQIFRFIGLDDIKLIAADRMSVDPEASYQQAQAEIDALFSNAEKAA